MAEWREEDILRLRAKVNDLQTSDQVLEKQVSNLEREKDVYEQLAETSHVPTPTMSGTDSTPSLTAQLKARELGKEIEHVEGERADVAGELAHTEKALHETTLAAEGAREEQKIEETKKTVETAVELSTGEHGLLAGVETGGTAQHIGDAVAYVRHVTVPYIEHVVVPHFQSIADDLAAPYKVSDEGRLMHEQTLHEQNLGELSDVKKDLAAQMGEKGLTDADFKEAIDDTKTRFKEQDDALAKVREETRVADEGLRDQQDVTRAAMDAETVAKRQEVVKEVLTPMAEHNVHEQHAATLSRNAASNQQNLDNYGMTLEGRPDAEQAQKAYAKWLDEDQQSLQKSLDAQRSQDVTREMGALQQQHFPEVTPPGVSGPGVEQSVPAQPAPGTSSPGTASPTGPPPPQQQGPSGPAM